MKKITIDNKEIEISDESFEALKSQLISDEWVLKHMEGYWYVNDSGYMGKDFWFCNDFDNYRLDMGNVFRTKEEAKARVVQLRAEARVRREIREKGYALKNVDWGDETQKKYYIYYSYHIAKIDFDWSVSTVSQSNPLFSYLKDGESCEALIKSHGEDIKLAMGIK